MGAASGKTLAVTKGVEALGKKNHLSRVVDTLETSLEHVVSLMYSADRSPRYIIYHFE